MADKDSNKTEGARVLPCTCIDKAGALGQDKLYGPGMRLHNACAKGWRCTNCRSEKPGGKAEKPAP